MEDYLLFERMAHFNRERIPERIVHAKGAGAYGTFTVTRDITKYTSAKLFSEIGKKTETVSRFSTVAGELGSADTVRDPRGFVMRFYTEDIFRVVTTIRRSRLGPRCPVHTYNPGYPAHVGQDDIPDDILRGGW